MSVSFFGDYDTTETVVIPFNSFTSDDPSASVTLTNLANTDVYIYKDGSLTQRTSSAGVAVDVDVDAIAGNHWVTIDLSDNTDAGFYVAGSRYQVRMEGVTIDGATINAWIGAFSIGCTLQPATAGRTLVVDAAGLADANVVKLGPTGAGTAQTARDIGASVLLSSGTGTGQIALTSGAVDTVTTVTTTTTATNVTTVNGLAANVITAASIAADAGTEIGTAVWATAARTLTAATNITSDGSAINVTAGVVDTVTTTTTATTATTVTNVSDKTGYTATLTNGVHTIQQLVIAGGSGAGISITPAVTSPGILINGGATSGNAISIVTTNGDGIDCSSVIGTGIQATIVGDITGTIDTVTTLTTLPTIPANWITIAGITDGAFTAAKFAASSLDGKGDWNTVTPPTVNQILDETLTGHVTADSVAVALKDILEDTGTTIQSLIGTPGSDLATEIAAIKAETVLIVEDTGITIPGTITTLQADTDDIQTRLPAALTGAGLMSSDVTAISTSTAAADNLEASALGIVKGTMTGTPNTTTIAASALPATVDDTYNGRVIVITSGAAAGEATDITDYTGSSREMIVTALANTPGAGDTFVIV